MFLPTTIDIENSEQYVLSMRIHPSKFMFSLFRPNDGKNFCLRETILEKTNETLCEKIQRIIFELNFLTQQFAQTNVIYVSPEYQMIPTALFESKGKDDLFRFSQHDDNKSHIVVNYIPKYQTSILWGMDTELHAFLKRSLYNPHFYHQSPLLIDFFEGNSRVVSLHAKMYVSVSEHSLDILCFKDGRILHLASYENLSTSETTYYILKKWEALKMDQFKDQLLIMGNADDSLLKVLREYIRNIERLTLPSDVYLWNEDALQTPIDLLSLSL